MNRRARKRRDKRLNIKRKMTNHGKAFLFLGVLSVLLAAGLAVVLCFASLMSSGAGSEGGLMIVAAGMIYLCLSPGLLVPYAVLFWRTRPEIKASLSSALGCGLLYPALLMLIPLVMEVLGWRFGEGWRAWVSGWLLALIPGTILAYLGTYFGQGSNRCIKKSQGQTQEQMAQKEKNGA